MKNKLNQIFTYFESRINPYPDNQPVTPHKGLFPFIWSCLDGMRGWVLMLAIFSAGNGILEALLFQFMGKLVDWLGKFSPQNLLSEHGWAMLGMALVLVFSVLWRFINSTVRLQTLQGVFPMRLRWNFHRLMLAQSLGFYQDEFAGRVSAKVMQTALSVREVVMTIVGMVVYVLVYFLRLV